MLKYLLIAQRQYLTPFVVAKYDERPDAAQIRKDVGINFDRYPRIYLVEVIQNIK